MRKGFISLSKFGKNGMNEDSVIATEKLIAVSDGAGGGGLYADKWSEYLVNHLPETPIRSHEELDSWVDSIWEDFYNEYEQIAKQSGGMVLNKFYDEGSFATIAAIWKVKQTFYWVTYGDSVAFHYNKKSGILEHSFTCLTDFNKPPYLINYQNQLKPEGCKTGVFEIDDDSVVFCASDALAHYLIMMYELENKDKYMNEIHEASHTETKNSQIIIHANSLNKKNVSFSKTIDILTGDSNKRIQASISHIKSLLYKKYIAPDDISFAFME